MKKIFLLITLFAFFYSSQAQFTENPTGIWTTTDNIGIGGLNTNGYKFHVDGIQRINSGAETSNLLNINAWISNTTKYKGSMLNFTTATDGNYGHFKFIEASDANGLRFSLNSQGNLYTSGNIGIGTTNPDYRISIEDNDTDKLGISIYNTTYGSNQGRFLFLKTGNDYAVTDQKNSGVIESYNDLILSAASGSGATQPMIKFQTARTGTVGNTKMIINHLGDVGIGTIAPNSKLEVNGNVVFDNLSNTYTHIRLGHDANDNIISDNSPQRYFGGGYFFRVHNEQVPGNYINALTITDEGNIGIGTNNTFGYKIAVNGTIGSKEVKVEASSPWPDFVFEKGYKLQTLEEVEEHITEKGHLPEIPSEAEVAENGINLGEMDAKLLQKIEELTLYLIEQNKKLESQGALIEILQSEVTALKNE